VPYAERIAWLASWKAGLVYSLDVHDPVLRLASADHGGIRGSQSMLSALLSTSPEKLKR
jgi:hypothetical protein